MSGILDIFFYPMIFGASIMCSQGDGISVGYEFTFDQSSLKGVRPALTCGYTGSYEIPFTQEKFESDLYYMKEKVNEEYNNATNSGIRWNWESRDFERDL